MKLSNICALYPTLNSIFETRVKDAKFDRVPIKARNFRDLKLGVISLLRILDKYKRLRRETRSALFQALVVEHNFQQAFNLLPKKYNVLPRWALPWFWADTREAESFRSEMRTFAAQLSDSQFLQDLESTNDEDLRPAAQEAKALAQRELSSSIDAVVENLTHDVLVMQQNLCARQAQLQLDNEERGVLKMALVEFIREINKQSAQGQNS